MPSPGNELVKKYTGADGIALIRVPKGAAFAGVALYGNLSQPFSSSDVDSSGGKNTLTIKMPSKPSSMPALQYGASNFTMQLLLANGSVAPNHALNVSFAGQVHQLTTDSGGLAMVTLSGSGPLIIMVAQNEYDYQFPIPYVGQSFAKVALYPLLFVNSFISVPDGSDCYRVIANVTDPRTSLPLDVEMQRFGANSNVSLPLTTGQGGIFTSRLCITSETAVAVRASNKYESAGAILDLVPSSVAVGPIKLPGMQNNPAVVATPVAKAQPQPVELLLPALFLGFAAIAVLLFVMARNQLAKMLRFIAQYIYKLARDLQKKRPPKGQQGGVAGEQPQPEQPPEEEPPSE